MSDLIENMRSSIMIQDEENQAITKLTDIFSHMCNRLGDDIIQQRTLQERTLLDFSKLVLRIITISPKELPVSFDDLFSRISDYWHYELKEDRDSERKYSYIRLYQMISIISTFYIERKLENTTRSMLEKNRVNADTLSIIQRFPGITCKKLSQILNVLPISVRKQLDPLVKDGFLSSRRSGDEQYYMLTNAGDVLHQSLVAQSPVSDQWGSDRTYVLCFVLGYFQKLGVTDIPVLTIVKRVAACTDSTIAELVNMIKYASTNAHNYNSGRYTYVPISYRLLSKDVEEVQHKPSIFDTKVMFLDDANHTKQLNIYESIRI